MGRGRAKAKQTKVARQLKYQTLDTDFDALQRELGSEGNPVTAVEPEDYDADEYGAYDDAEEDEASRRHVG